MRCPRATGYRHTFHHRRRIDRSADFYEKVFGGRILCCLDCGKEFAYSTQLMCTVSKEEQLKDRGQCRWNHDSEFNEEKEMKLSQMYRTALIATTMLILSSGLDMGGFA